MKKNIFILLKRAKFKSIKVRKIWNRTIKKSNNLDL